MATSAAAELPLLTTGVLIAQIRATFEQLPDVRKGGNNQRYAVADAVLSAFAIFFTQSLSFLDYQVRMQKARGRNHATSLFGAHAIPCDQQIRNLLGPVPRWNSRYSCWPAWTGSRGGAGWRPTVRSPAASRSSWMG